MTVSFRLERDSRAFVLGGQPLARGGEAAIYEVPHQPGLVAKVYHQPNAEYADKVAAMLAAPPTDPMAGRGHVSIAWPLDRLLETGASRFRGFVMPRVDKVRPMLEFYNPASRLELCPLFHFGYLLRTARNLAAAVRAIHERGYVIGDLNESNLLVNNMALVTLVDTDSFQVPRAQRMHRCPVGKPEYTPPELQGTRFADFDRGPEHDAFALAIIVFQLLMQGIHPFAGRFTGKGEPGGLNERIAAGHWPYVRGRQVPYAANPHAPPFDVLPPQVQQLMFRCFEEGHARSALRPDAAVWHQALLEGEKELASCPLNSQHRFHRGQSACPWCALARRQGRDLFPSAEDVQAGRVGVRANAGRAPEAVQVALAPIPMGRQQANYSAPAVSPRTTPPATSTAAPPRDRPRDIPAPAPILTTKPQPAAPVGMPTPTGAQPEPVSATGTLAPRWLLGSVLAAVAGLAVVVGGTIVVAIMVWILGDRAPATTNAALGPPKQEQTKAPGGQGNKNDDKDKTTSTPADKGQTKDGDEPKRDNGVGLDSDLASLLRESIAKRNYTQTELIGGGFNSIGFEEIPPKGGLLIGIEVGFGTFVNVDVIHSLRPIFMTDNGEVLGSVRGVSAERNVTVKAKNGYAVASVSGSSGLLIDTLKVTFMRLDKKYLDMDHRYETEVLTSKNKNVLTKTIGGNGALVIGICGRTTDKYCNGLGLVLRGDKAK